MAELRQRKGEPASKDEEIAKLRAEVEALKKNKDSVDDSAAPRESEDEQKRRLAEEIVNTLAKPNRKTVKGLSNCAKHWKEELAKDPFNMELIFKLGVAYAEDERWEQSSIVLMRGWKRVSELQDPDMKFEFLTCLAQASQNTKKFRQALAVLNSIEDVTAMDDEARSRYEALRCQIHCQNGDWQRGLQALSNAIEGQSFEQAVAIWASCTGPLKKVGAYDEGRDTVSALASSDEDLEKLGAMEKLMVLKEELQKTEKPQAWDKRMQYSVAIFAAGMLVAVVYLLHWIESQSLSRLRQ